MTSEAAVAHLAKLAGLHVPADQLPRFAREMDALVKMIGTVQDANVEGVEPLVSFAREGRNSEGSWMREDEESTETAKETEGKRDEQGRELLKHASKLDRDYYVVKRAVPGQEEGS